MSAGTNGKMTSDFGPRLTREWHAAEDAWKKAEADRDQVRQRAADVNAGLEPELQAECDAAEATLDRRQREFEAAKQAIASRAAEVGVLVPPEGGSEALEGHLVRPDDPHDEAVAIRAGNALARSAPVRADRLLWLANCAAGIVVGSVLVDGLLGLGDLPTWAFLLLAFAVGTPIVYAALVATGEAATQITRVVIGEAPWPVAVEAAFVLLLPLLEIVATYGYVLPKVEERTGVAAARAMGDAVALGWDVRLGVLSVCALALLPLFLAKAYTATREVLDLRARARHEGLASSRWARSPRLIQAAVRFDQIQAQVARDADRLARCRAQLLRVRAGLPPAPLEPGLAVANEAIAAEKVRMDRLRRLDALDVLDDQLP